MKIHKIFTLDIEIVDRLNRIDNQSALINELLSDYFSIRADKITLFDQKRAERSALKKKVKRYRGRLRFWRHLTHLILIIFAWFGSKKFGETKSPTWKQSRSTQGEGT